MQGNVAAILLDQGDLAAAEPCSALRSGRFVPPGRMSIRRWGVARLQLGTLLMQKGEMAEAEAGMREGLRVIEAALPSDHWRVGQARMRLGACLADMGRFEEAESLLLSSFEILEPQRRAPFRDWRQLLSELFDLYTALDQPEKAAPYRELFRTSQDRLPRGWPVPRAGSDHARSS